MNIVQTCDVALIQSIMMHEDILPTIIDDTWSGSAYFPDVHNETFLAVVVDDTLIGTYRLHWIDGVTLQAHAHILKEHREHSVESAKSVMEWILRFLNRCKKVESRVPFVYPNVKQFLVVCGFTEEGISRKSFMLDDQLHDQWVMGITREEMQEFSNG